MVLSCEKSSSGCRSTTNRTSKAREPEVRCAADAVRQQARARDRFGITWRGRGIGAGTMGGKGRA